jgi:hypothetical protein
MHVEDTYIVVHVYAEYCYTCIHKEIIISWGDQISCIEYTAKNVQCLVSLMLHNPIGIGLEVSKMGDSCNSLKKSFRNTRVR